MGSVTLQILHMQEQMQHIKRKNSNPFSKFTTWQRILSWRTRSSRGRKAIAAQTVTQKPRLAHGHHGVARLQALVQETPLMIRETHTVTLKMSIWLIMVSISTNCVSEKSCLSPHCVDGLWVITCYVLWLCRSSLNSFPFLPIPPIPGAFEALVVL